MPENIRDVTPAHVLPAPAIEDRMIVRLPAVAPPAPPPRPPRPVTWPRARVLSAGILRSKGTDIVIADIEPLGPEALCADGKGGDWPCGNFARAALQRLVRQRTIECDPTENSEDEEGAQRIVTRCAVAGRDIGEWLVARGWAIPLAERGYEAAFALARADRLGQWGAGRQTD